MNVIRIDGAGAARAGSDWWLADRDLRRTGDRFIAEGRLVVQRLIEAERFTIRALLLSDAALAALQPWLERLDDEPPIYVCGAPDFLAITGYNIHRGCLALVDRPPVRPVADVAAGPGTIVVLDGVANADNVGGVFRNAAAFGVGAVLLGPGTCDPLYRKAVRTSMGASLQIPFAAFDNWRTTGEVLCAAGCTIVALTPRLPSQTLDDIVARSASRRIALVVGSEGAGVSAEAEQLAAHHVRIPIAPTVDSLNLTVAVGIALSWLTARRHR